MGNYTTCTDDSFFADRHSTKDGSVAANGSAFLDKRGDYRPIRFRLQFSRTCGRAGVFVVDEHDAMTNEDFVFDGYTFTDEGMT